MVARQQPAAPVSPCVNICELGPDDICRGCGRSLDEIARWGTAAAGERRLIVDRARKRLQEKDEK